MSSIQNEDVKGIPELDVAGLPYSKLIHDTKIWITSEGISRTLHDAILDRAIGLKGTAGARIKDQSIFTQDTPTPIGTPIGAGFDGTALLRSDDEEFTFLDSFTISGFAYLTDKSNDMILINRWGGTGDKQYKIQYNSTDDRFEFVVNKADNVEEIVFDGTSPSLNTWYFITCRFEKGVGIEISVDNGVMSSTGFITPLRTNAVTPLYFGGGNGVIAEAFLGRLDSWTFLNRLATNDEVTELYNLGNGKAYEILSVPLKQDVIGHWDFDEGDGQTRISKGKKSYTAIDLELYVGGEVVASSGISQPYQDDNLNVLGSFINGEGNTEIAVPWGFRSDSLIYSNIGLQHWIEYESDDITPDCWFRKKPSEGTIEFFGDILTPNDPIIIVSLEGVPPPTAAIAIVSGLQPKNESCGNTTNLTQSTGVNSVSVVGGKTQIEFNFDIDAENLRMLYVNNKFWPQYKPNITADKYFNQINGNTIELDQDYSALNYKFYFAEFFEKDETDEYGNMCIPLTPYFRTFGLASPNLTTWAIGVNDNGNIVTNDLYDVIPDNIRFKRDDSVICSITVDIEGDLAVDDNPVGAGILFDNMWFLSPNGSIFQIGIANDNKLYTIDGDGQKFCVTDSAGDEIYSVQKYSKGAVLGQQYYAEGSIPPVNNAALDSDNETVFSFIEVNGVPALHFYNPIDEKWELSNISKGGEYAIGETIESILDTNDFREQYGPWWYKLNGLEVIDANLFPEFLEICPIEWYNENTGEISLPNYQRYDYEAQSGNGPNANVRTPVPDGWGLNNLWAGITSIRRIYFAGNVDGNDTITNDHLLDPAQNATYSNVANNEQRAAGYYQYLNVFSRRVTNTYIKVK